MKGLVLVTGDEGLRREAEAYFISLGVEFSNELPLERTPDRALVADLGLLAPLAAGLPNQDLTKVFGQVVALSSGGGFHARIQAVRIGATAFLERPASAADICDLLEECGGVGGDDPLKVLVVDDDPIAARVTGRQLELAGMRVVAVEDPAKAVEAMLEFEPDLAVLDLYMPQCSGIELAQVIRQMKRFEALPLVFLSSEGELAAQMNAVSAGGDDFVSKGTPAALMIPLIRSRATRMRKISRILRVDAMTRLLPHSAFNQTLQESLSAAEREKGPLCLALLDLDGFRAINDIHGHGVGDGIIKGLGRLLRYRLRPADRAGRFSGQQFGIVLPGLAASEAAAMVDSLRVIFASLSHGGVQGAFQATFSAGVVEAMPGENGEALIARVRQQVARAKDGGRNRVTHA